MTKVCNKCGREKAITSFYRNKNQKDGRLPTCKICQNEIVKKYQYKKDKSDKTHDDISLTGLSKKDWCTMYEALEKLGYNVEDDIHAQFNERHGFTKYKKRPTRNLKTFCYKDCLEISDEADSLSNE